MIFYLRSYSDFFLTTTINMKTIVRKPLIIKINKLRLRNLDNVFLVVLKISFEITLQIDLPKVSNIDLMGKYDD